MYKSFNGVKQLRNNIRQVEILAPGGSLDGIKAAYRAGADAVYTGGSKFGAREYADNLNIAQMEDAINYAHIHDKKIYLTVNTLLKDNEIDNMLIEYLSPIVNLGIDAVIVQDFGVMKLIHDVFPMLPIHASTQMTILGRDTSQWLKQYGVDRIVTPREMSLEEIRYIYEATGMEIESFVHGALCYCYSGQCFMSSYIGGRSGNRGRCAQPCRMEYDVYYKGKMINKGDCKYVLSPKDINTLEILPELIEAGVYSLKIEGRMKKPEYAAGITALYRKYVDLYYRVGKEGYNVDKNDLQEAFDLFNRNGFSHSYYKQHNSRDMISLKKPAFRQENTTLINEIKEKYINNEIKENINIYISILKGHPITITTQCGDICSVTYGEVPDIAQKAPITKETVVRQMSKLGNTPFSVTNPEKDIQIELDDGLFIPMGELNELRRRSVDELQNMILEEHSSNNAISTEFYVADDIVKFNDSTINYELNVLVSDITQLQTVIKTDLIKRIYIESDRFGREAEALKQIIDGNNIEFVLAMPRVFRENDKVTFEHKYGDIINLFSGYLIRNIEEYFYLKNKSISSKMIIFDYNVYTFNNHSKKLLESMESGALYTIPVELNRKELKLRSAGRDELIVYGYMPDMTTANCIQKTCDECNHKNNILELKDRTSQYLKVKCICDYCYNVIYNTKPISLLKFKGNIDELSIKRLRIEFTFEDESEVNSIIKMYHNVFIDNNFEEDSTDSTRGHFNKGVM